MIKKHENTASQGSSVTSKQGAGTLAEKIGNVIKFIKKEGNTSGLLSQKSELATSSNKENEKVNEATKSHLDSVQENENEIANITIADSYQNSQNNSVSENLKGI